MSKLIIEIEIQTYDDDEAAILSQIAETVTAVVSLADLSVGTFVRTEIKNEAGE